MTIIKSATSVEIDGRDFGCVADTIANNPKRASDVQRALVTFLAEKDAALAALTAEFAAYREAAGKAATAIKAVITDPTKDDAVTVATITQIVAYGEREANKTANERELEAAQAALATVQAKIAELS